MAPWLLAPTPREPPDKVSMVLEALHGIHYGNMLQILVELRARPHPGAQLLSCKVPKTEKKPPGEHKCNLVSLQHQAHLVGSPG